MKKKEEERRERDREEAVRSGNKETQNTTYMKLISFSAAKAKASKAKQSTDARSFILPDCARLFLSLARHACFWV